MKDRHMLSTIIINTYGTSQSDRYLLCQSNQILPPDSFNSITNNLHITNLKIKLIRVKIILKYVKAKTSPTMIIQEK